MYTFKNSSTISLSVVMPRVLETIYGQHLDDVFDPSKQDGEYVLANTMTTITSTVTVHPRQSELINSSKPSSDWQKFKLAENGQFSGKTLKWIT